MGALSTVCTHSPRQNTEIHVHLDRCPDKNKQTKNTTPATPAEKNKDIKGCTYVLNVFEVPHLSQLLRRGQSRDIHILTIFLTSTDLSFCMIFWPIIIFATHTAFIASYQA